MKGNTKHQLLSKIALKVVKLDAKMTYTHYNNPYTMSYNENLEMRSPPEVTNQGRTKNKTVQGPLNIQIQF